MHIHIWLSSAEETNTSQLSAAESPNPFAFFSTFLSFMWGEKKKEKKSSLIKKKSQDWKYVLVLLQRIFGDVHNKVQM